MALIAAPLLNRTINPYGSGTKVAKRRPRAHSNEGRRKPRQSKSPSMEFQSAADCSQKDRACEHPNKPKAPKSKLAVSRKLSRSHPENLYTLGLTDASKARSRQYRDPSSPRRRASGQNDHSHDGSAVKRRDSGHLHSPGCPKHTPLKQAKPPPPPKSILKRPSDRFASDDPYELRRIIAERQLSLVDDLSPTSAQPLVRSPGALRRRKSNEVVILGIDGAKGARPRHNRKSCPGELDATLDATGRKRSRSMTILTEAEKRELLIGAKQVNGSSNPFAKIRDQFRKIKI